VEKGTRSQAVARIADHTASLQIVAIVAKKHLQLFLRYWALSILQSWVWPLGVTWRQRSR